MLVVVEIQKDNTGREYTTELFDDTAQAKARYHELLAEASVSDVPEHSVILVSEEGNFMFHEKYVHERGEE